MSVLKRAVMKFEMPPGPTLPTDAEDAAKESSVLTKPIRRSYSYPTKNRNKHTMDDKNPEKNSFRNEDLKRFSFDDDINQPGFLLCALDEMNVAKGGDSELTHDTGDENWNNNYNDRCRVDEANNHEKSEACVGNLEFDSKGNPVLIKQNRNNNEMSEECQGSDIGNEVGPGRDQQESNKMKRSYSEMTTQVTVDNGNNSHEAHLTRRENKRKRLEVQNQPKSVNNLSQSKKAFPKPQEVIEAITRKFQDDMPKDFTEDFVFILTGSYYAAHLWRQHCTKTDNVKDLDLLSFGDIDIFYSLPYQPKRNEILDQNSQKDSAAPGFMECYYRNLEINDCVYEINYVRRVDLFITGGYFQLRDFIQNHIDINLVQAGVMVRLCGEQFDLTHEYSSEAFENFLNDPEHIVAIPDIVNTDSPGNSLIRVLTKSAKFKLPYQLPERSQLLKVDFSKRPLVQKFMNGLWALPPHLQREILDTFDLSVTWRDGRKLTTFSLKLRKKQTRMVWDGDHFELFYE